MDISQGRAVDLVDLGAQEVNEMVTVEIDHEFVDGLSLGTAEDVDRHDVAADRADPAGYQPQRAGAVRQVDPEHVGDHTGRVRGPQDRWVTTA